MTFRIQTKYSLKVSHLVQTKSSSSRKRAPPYQHLTLYKKVWSKELSLARGQLLMVPTRKRSYPWKLPTSLSQICTWTDAIKMPRQRLYSTWSLQNHYCVQQTICPVAMILKARIKYWHLENLHHKLISNLWILIKYLSFKCKIQKVSFLKINFQVSFTLFFYINPDLESKEPSIISLKVGEMMLFMTKTSALRRL